MYKHMLTLAKRLPAKEQPGALTAIRSAFRANKDVDQAEQWVPSTTAGDGPLCPPPPPLPSPRPAPLAFANPHCRINSLLKLAEDKLGYLKVCA